MQRGRRGVWGYGAIACLAFVVAGCSTDGTSYGTTSGAPEAGIYVIQDTASTATTPASSSILEFSTTTTGSASAVSTLAAATGTAFEFLAVDALGDIYTSSQASAASSIDEYAAGSANDAAAKRSIPFDSTTGLTALSGLAVDPAGSIYASTAAGSISIFSATATGPAAPASGVSITSGAGPQATAIAPDGTLYVATAPPVNNIAIAPVVVFAAGAASPSRSLGGALTLLADGSPKSLATDAAGNLYVANVVSGVSSILVFGPGASGDTAPLRVISGSSTLLGCAGGMAVDTEGYLYVVSTAKCGSTANPTVLKFSTTGDGNIAPVSSFTSTAWSNSDAALSIAVY